MLITTKSLINENLLNAAAAEFPDLDWPHWHHYENGKLATHDESRIPPACRLVLHEIIKDVPVPSDCFADFSFYGAGLHCMPPGSRLGTHLDSQLHPNRRWLRTHSAVLSLNRNWQESQGGCFQIANQKGGRDFVWPKFGNLTVFACTEYAYHNVTTVCGPEARKTLAVFFWRQIPAHYTIEQFRSLRTKAHFVD